MTWGAVAATTISAGVNLYGANKAAKTQADATNRQIREQRAMQEQAAEAAKFRPVGVTSPYGQAQFQVVDGQLTGAGFELSPEMQARAAQFGMLGESALAGLTTDPMKAAAERTARLEALAVPGRAEAQERLFSGLAAKGLTGLAVETGTGARVNPYAAALMQEQERQRALTAAESYDVSRGQMAEDFAMAQRLFGAQTGIYDVGQQQLGTALDIADIERQRAISAATGQAQFGTNISNLMAGQAASRAQQQSALYGGIGSTLSGLNFNRMFSGGIPSPTTTLPGFGTMSGSGVSNAPLDATLF